MTSKLIEEKAALAAQGISVEDDEFSVDDLRYLRVGHIPRGRVCDSIAQRAFDLVGGNTLPSNWRLRKRWKFNLKYQHLGRVLWAKTASYQLLIYLGYRMFRIWTDLATKSLVDVNADVVPRLSKHLEIEDVPKSAYRKSAPLIHRVRLYSSDEIDIVVKAVEETYGICFARM